MRRDELVAHCLAKPGAWLDEPWEGDEVVKVGTKIFAFLGSPGGGEQSVGIKCGATREEADELIETFPDDVSVMAYIGRSGWNNVRIAGGVTDDEVLELVDASYAAVLAKLPKRLRPG